MDNVFTFFCGLESDYFLTDVNNALEYTYHVKMYKNILWWRKTVDETCELKYKKTLFTSTMP